MRENAAVVPAVEGSCCSIAGWYAPRRVRGWPLLWSILLTCLLLLISSLSAQAACRVGLIDTDTVWSVADSPCIVDQSVWVVEGVTLTIEPGVVVKVTPGVPPREVDLYLAVRLPEPTGGMLLFLQGDGRLSRETRPLLRRWTLAPYQGEVFRYTFGGGEPAGSYAWLAVFTEPGTLSLVGEIIQLPFRFHP